MDSLARIISNPSFGYVMYAIAGMKLFNDYKNNNNKSLVIFAMTTITMMNVRKNLPLAILVGLTVSNFVSGSETFGVGKDPYTIDERFALFKALTMNNRLVDGCSWGSPCWRFKSKHNIYNIRDTRWKAYLNVCSWMFPCENALTSSNSTPVNNPKVRFKIF